MVIKQRFAVLHGEFENEKKKDQKFYDLGSGDLNPRFSNFPDHNLNFLWKVRVMGSNLDNLLKSFLL